MALHWKPSGMCGTEAEFVDGTKILQSTWQNGDGSKGGFTLTYEFVTYRFTSRADAYAAAELVALAKEHAAVSA